MKILHWVFFKVFSYFFTNEFSHPGKVSRKPWKGQYLIKKKAFDFCWKVFVDLFRASRLSLPEGFFPDSFFILPPSPYGKGMDDYDSWMYRGPLGNSFELQIFQIIKTTSSYLDWFLLNFWSILDHIWLVVDLISDFRFNLIHYKSIFCWLFLYFVIYFLL